jgi:hypothetical protein
MAKSMFYNDFFQAARGHFQQALKIEADETTIKEIKNYLAYIDFKEKNR